MALYETIFILDSLLPPEEIEKQVDRIKELLESNNCKVIEIDRWGKRRLTYEIHKKQYGFYVVIEFESDGTAPQILNNEFNYNDKVLRYLTYRFNKNKLKDREKTKSKVAKDTKDVEMKSEVGEIKDAPIFESVVGENAEEGKETEDEKTNE
jgi:small subunit ribosomal protein S6